MITIYSPTADDFSTLGLGALAPYEVIIEEEAGGLYELTMTHPMDEGGKWLNIGPGCIIKAPAPVRETPLAEEDAASEPVTVTRKIYKVQTNTGANLHLRQGPSTSTKILSKYRPGTEVAVLSQSGGWGKVIVCRSGATGYMSMQYLVYVRDETETVSGDAPSPERVIYPVQSRGQLFRIVSVERDAAEREVRVTARHIFYDLLGNVVKNEYAPEGVAADTVVNQIFDRALNDHGFDVHCSATQSVTGEYTRRGVVECLLDPDDGVVPQAGARLVRDNFDIWILPDSERETGVTIRHGKNLLGAAMTTDWSDLVTRIIPVGQTKDGKPLLLSGTVYVDSPRIGDYPVIAAKAVEYDVKVGQEGISNASQARAKLTELAQADFSDNGADLPTVGLDVDFVALGQTEAYAQYADLQAVHLYDTVRVIAKTAGIDAAVRVTGYKWDALGLKYESVTLGEISDLKPTVYSYEIPRGAIKTIKIAAGAVGAAQIRDLAVQYAHIDTAAVEQLSADSITALKAYITEIVAGSVTTDELYAGIAEISKAQITTANIDNANIDWAQIGDLQAGNIEALVAHINALTAGTIEADELYAAFGHMLSLTAGSIQSGSVETDSLAAALADIIHAEVDVGEFNLAEIQNLLANALVLQQGQAGSMMITNLAVTSANLLNATIGTLVMPGTDGKYYAVSVGTGGALTTEEVTVTEGEIAAGQTSDGRQIAATTINADSINGSNISAQQATINELLTGALTAGQITAAQAMIASASIPTLYAASIKALGDSIDISANESITLLAGEVAAAQEAAEKAAPIEGTEPPAEAPEAGRLWLDTGVDPSVLRRWRGADVTTARAFAYTVQGCGKNLLPPIASTTVAGITYQNRGDGTYLANGTCTGVTNLELFRGVLPPGRYTLSGSDSDLKVQVSVYNAAGSWVRDLAISSDYQPVRTFTVDDLREGEAYHRVFFQAEPTAVGQTFTNVILSPQLERSETGTAYEPYEDIPLIALDNGQGQLSQIAVEAGCTSVQEKRKNLLPPIGGQTKDGVTIAMQESGGVHISGTCTATSGTAVFFDLELNLLLNGTYTLSMGNETAVGSHLAIRLRGADGETLGDSNAVATGINAKKTFSVENQTAKWFTIRVGGGETYDVTVYPQLEAGSAATAFEAYRAVLPISGRESVEIRACGKNLLPVKATSETSFGITCTGNGDGSYTMSGTATDYSVYELWQHAPLNGTYTLSGGKDGVILLLTVNDENGWLSNVAFSGSGGTTTITAEPLPQGQYYRLLLQALPGTAVDNAVFYPQLEAGETATAFEAYEDMGGGTIAPTSPLYGLPLAMDSVEIDADGDVLVTHRTHCRTFDGTEAWTRENSTDGNWRFFLYAANVSPSAKPPAAAAIAANIICSHFDAITGEAGWTGTKGIAVALAGDIVITDPDHSTLEDFKGYLAAQAAAGTPVTVVYELAAPTAEALTAVPPIAPQPGTVNLITGGDRLTAEISGSGWQVVNDTSDVRAALSGVDGDLAALASEVGLLEGQVGSIAEQIITPDGVKSIVLDSDEYRLLAQQASLTADGLSVTQTTVENLDGRVETLESGVHIAGAEIGIYASDSPFRMQIDNTGWEITQDGQSTISARESKIVAPRVQVTDALMLGSLAVKSSEGRLRLLKYGG